MSPAHIRNWVLGAIALVVIYATVIYIGRHLHPAPPIKPGEIVHQADGPALTLELGDGQNIQVIRIIAGDFQMGSPETEAGHDTNESPLHTVHIAHDFYLGKYDVTQSQWKAVMINNQSANQTAGSLPAEQVSWDDCQEFCKRVSKRNGRTVRLPSEAEWEYACRAGAQSVFTSGDTLSSTQANFDGTAPYGGAGAGPKLNKTSVVGTYPENAWELYDMHGNVWQWCQDVYHPDYVGAPADGSAWETGADPSIRVYRGGSFQNIAEVCRSATRWAADHNTRGPTIGFRIAADLSPDQ